MRVSNLNRLSRYAGRVFVFVAVLASVIPAQEKASGWSVNDSFSKAVSLTETALKKLTAGVDRDASAGIYWEGTGTYDISARLQGLTGDAPDLFPITEKFGFDTKSGALMYEYKTNVNHDADEWIRYVYDRENRLLIVNPSEKWAIWLSNSDTENQRRGYARMLPHVLLEEALKNRQTLRYQGNVRLGDESVDVVNFSIGSDQTISLYFSKDGQSFRGLEYLVDHPLLGDTPVRWLFDDYRPTSGIGLFPHSYEVFLGDRRLKRVDVKKVGNRFDAADHTKSTSDIKVPDPPGAKSESAAQAPKPDPPIEQIGKNVFRVMNIRGGFHVLVVEFDSYLMVVDAPAGYHELQQIPAFDWAGEEYSSAVGDRYLRVVKKKFPDKPVRYVVLTHHHGDHAGGIFPFIREGATVLAGDETLKVIENARRRSFMLNSRQKPVFPDSSNIIRVGEKYSISDESMKVDIIDVGQNPHSANMLVVYLPDQRLLFQSDLFIPFKTDSEPSLSRLRVMKWFTRWLDRSGITPEKIYSVHGSAVITKRQIEKVRKLRN